MPAGVAQIGKAFRNEITPRNFVFRSREFEQMEIEPFCSDEGDAWRACHAGVGRRGGRAWLVDRAGLRAELLGEDVHEDLAHYARARARTSRSGSRSGAGAAGHPRAGATT